jgi:SAM-dependent methyltransferase
MVFKNPVSIGAQEHYLRGVSLQREGRGAEALAAFEEAINTDFSFDPAFAAAAEIFLAQGQVLPAADCYACAIRARPEREDYKKKFIEAIMPFRFTERNEELRAVILQCLETPGLDCSFLSGVWASDIKLDPAYPQLKSREIFSDAFFLRGLERLLVADVAFEKFLVALRRYLLEAGGHEELVAALAQYCAFNEYIFDVSEEEKEILKNCKDAGLRACYEATKSYRVRDDIPALTSINEGVSQAVQGQYEVFPYPRWSGFESDIRSEEIEGRFRGKKAKILVAGCGTGKEAIELASVFPDASVLAVDLSRASLTYGIDKAEEFGIKNVTFKQADILGLGVVKEKFDYIASSGVLHHMKEPLEGWKVLVDLLKPGGLMRIALYSEIARREITAARQVIAREKIPSDADGIRLFRRKAAALLKKKTYENITNFRDYYSMSECRDLLFHVHEHCFTLPQLEESLEKLNLKFAGFYLPPDTIKRQKNALDLKNWAAFEEKNPDTFNGMYRFWCYKD